MSLQLKSIDQQVIVITGATSGIGLTTARLAARQGAKVVLCARNEEDLQQAASEIQQAGGQAVHATADVGDFEQVRRVAQRAIDAYGGFDTWVNNAGVSIYGKLAEVSLEDHRKLFETNFWGLVNGSLIAAEHLKQRGGAIINLGSVLSDRAIPLQGMYCASKHAVKGFTDALRMEVEKDGWPIAVTLVKPSAIDTPYTEHATNYLESFPQNPPPVYAPDTVARAILHCAQRAVRDVTVGGGGKMIASLGNYAPRLLDRLMEGTMFDMQRSNKPKHGQPGLHESGRGLRERGEYEGHVAESSLYTAASLHPLATGAMLVGAGLAVAAALAGKRTRSGS